MSIAASENAPSGLVQWALTGLASLLVSGGAFLWRLMLRLEKLEATQTRQRVDLDASRSAGEAAMLRLTERIAQMHDDHSRLRETIGALPMRSDIRDLEDRLAERLMSLGERLDRAMDH